MAILTDELAALQQILNDLEHLLVFFLLFLSCIITLDELLEADLHLCHELIFGDLDGSSSRLLVLLPVVISSALVSTATASSAIRLVRHH